MANVFRRYLRIWWCRNSNYCNMIPFKKYSPRTLHIQMTTWYKLLTNLLFFRMWIQQIYTNTEVKNRYNIITCRKRLSKRSIATNCLRHVSKNSDDTRISSGSKDWDAWKIWFIYTKAVEPCKYSIQSQKEKEAKEDQELAVD